MKTILIALIILALSGCASQDYAQYVAAQSEANRIHVDTQKPLVRITAQPGMAITGLAGLEVYMPGAAPVIQQSRPSEWAGVVGQALGVVGAVGGIYAGGKAAEGLLNSASKFIQPSANVSTVSNTTGPVTTSTVGANSGANSGNSGRLAGTTMTDATSAPTVVTQPDPVIVTQPAPIVINPTVQP